jgi:hypothetical protein
VNGNVRANILFDARARRVVSALRRRLFFLNLSVWNLDFQVSRRFLLLLNLVREFHALRIFLRFYDFILLRLFHANLFLLLIGQTLIQHFELFLQLKQKHLLRVLLLVVYLFLSPILHWVPSLTLLSADWSPELSFTLVWQVLHLGHFHGLRVGHLGRPLFLERPFHIAFVATICVIKVCVVQIQNGLLC